MKTIIWNNILYICMTIIMVILMFEMDFLRKDIKEYDSLVSIHGVNYQNEKLIGKTIIIKINDYGIKLQENRVLLLLVESLLFLYFICCVIQLILIYENRKFKSNIIII